MQQSKRKKIRLSLNLSLFCVTSLGIALLFVLTGCSGKEKTKMLYLPHMDNTNVLKAQRGYDEHKSGTSMLMPPKGTIPRGFTPYTITSLQEAASLKNPVALIGENLKQGRRLYGVYCKVCHGPTGLGDGTVVPPFPKPTSFHSSVVRNYTDGQIFHIITRGKGNMPPYASQIQAKDRWSIVYYVRALQRAKNPSAADLKAAQE